MKLNALKLQKALNLAYRKQTVMRDEMENFKQHLCTLLERINTNESEENAKGHLSAFLKAAFYGKDYLIATKERADLVIHNGPKAKSPIGVLLETKRPQADSKTAPDMMRLDKPNVKALHELILYFLRERIEEQNNDLKYLIVTDVYGFFVFDAADFERLFYKNNKLVKDYKAWRDGQKTGQKTDFFYQEIAQPFVDQIETELDCVHFDLRDFAKYAQNQDDTDDHRLIPLFKILSPTHLLRISFANDSNSLNKDFYYELLHIIGLEETKVKNKKVIQRKPAGKRDPGSLLENAIRTLQTEDRLRRVPKLSSYGSNTEEQLFGVGLELSITWINRILFLKLLEAQLLQYHAGDKSYRFLNTELIKDYDELNELFFEALAKRKTERPDFVADKFAHIPYLNSSLFEISPLEDETIRVNSMKDRFDLPLYARTILKDEKGKRSTDKRKVLDYLFAFLDAYNFSSEGTETIQEDNKTLINASVLGLIFEKINGYQDGAFFTPGFITMYMCRETLRRATVQKFRDSAYFEDFDSEDFSDLGNYLGRKYKSTDLEQANDLVNSLKVCDPAVGSGHFLVSALNELLTIKSELGILCDRQLKPLPVNVKVANDELVVEWARTAELFTYQPGVTDSQTVQETLFHEKQSLIEGCLFGVDLNPNSVKICRLRLWIELLKNAYYNADQELETLPNIDINIKQGNSLISRFALDEDLRPVLKKSQWNITDYRLAVSSYHAARDKTAKKELLEQIDRIKGDFQTHIYNNDPRIKQLAKLRGQKVLLENKTEIGDLFGKLKEEDVTEDLQKLTTKLAKAESDIEDIRAAVIYRDAFEWRFEFPEVLDEEGDFVGFDAILGNPPYIRQEEFKDLKPYLKDHFETFAGTADLLVYFIERAYQVLAPEAHFSYIISNKFMRAGFGRALRTWLQERRLLEIIDFGDLPVFEEATAYPCILSWQKASPRDTFLAANVPTLEPEAFGAQMQAIGFTSLQGALTPEGWTLADAETQQLLKKLEQTGVPLGEYVDGKIYYGIKTGFNEAFVIDEATKDRLIAEDAKNAEVIKPFLAGRDVKRYQVPVANRYVLFTRRGIDIEQYPAIQEHLAQFKEQLMPRPKDWRGSTSDWPGRKPGSYKWYEIQDSVDYYEEFEKEKIMYQVFQVKPAFFYDTENLFANNAVWIITKGNKTLLGILNSKIGWFLIGSYCTAIQNGYQLISKYLMQIPIIAKKSKKIEALVNTVQETKQINPTADTTTQEAEIDILVYKLYGLTYAEVLLIDPGFGLGEAEYEKYALE